MSEVTIRKEMAEKKLGNVNKDYELTIEKLQVSQTGHIYNIILIVEVLKVVFVEGPVLLDCDVMSQGK
jgi:hypothetical protein